MQSVNTILGMMTSKITFMVLILCYIWMGYETNTELIYYVSSLFSQLNMQFGVAVPNAFVRIAQIIVSIQRLNKVLQADELERPEDESTEKPIVLMKDVGFKLGNKDILSGITMNIFNPGLTVVTGPVGAGKSSLLRVILKDYYPVSEGQYLLMIFQAFSNLISYYRCPGNTWQRVFCFSRPMAFPGYNTAKHTFRSTFRQKTL